MARLPYDHDRLQGDDRGYDARDWRSSPRVHTNRDLDRLIDEISRIAANEISRRARNSAVQTFYFNKMSRNDFLNEDFQGLVQFICDALEFQYAVGGIRRYDDKLEDSIHSCVMMHCGKQIRDHRELVDIAYDIDGEKHGRALQYNATKFEELVDQLERFHSEDKRDVHSGRRDDRSRDSRYSDDRRGNYRSERDRDDRGGSRGYRDFDNGRGSDYSRDSRGGRGDREERVVSGRETQARHEVSDNAPRYAEDMFIPLDSQAKKQEGYRGSRSFFTDDKMSESMSARSSGFSTSPPPAPAPTLAPVQSASPRIYHAPAMTPSTPPPPPPVGSRQVDYDDGKLWDLHSPKDSAAATPSQDPHQYDAPTEAVPETIPTTVTTGIGVFPLIRFTNGESQMDATAHAAVYPAGSEVPPVNMTEEVKRVMSLEAAITNPSITREQLADATNVVETLNIFNSLSSLALHVSEQATLYSINDSGDNTDGVRRIHHSFGVVDNSIIGFKHLSIIQGELRQTNSLRDILSLLERTMVATNTRASASAAFATDMRAACSRFDRLITREINLFCRHVLQLTKGNVMQSAVKSYNELVEYLDKDTSPGSQERNSAFLVFTNRLNASIHEAMNPLLGVEKGVIESNEIDLNVHGLAMLPFSYLVTHLPFTMEEMGLERNAEGGVVTEEGFTGFLKAALDVTGVEDDKLQTPLRLVVTRDMEVFRVFAFPGRRNSSMLVPVDVL